MGGKVRLAVQVGILICAAGFIALGGLRGEIATVLNKAVNICFECIGLG